MSFNHSPEITSVNNAAASIPHSRLKIATFNLFNYLEPPFAYYDFERIYSAEQWAKKQKWITDYVNEFQPDVIGFQEVFSPEALAELLREQGYEFFQVVDQPEVIDDFICRSPVVAIASKYPIVDIEAVQADTTLALAMGLKEDFSFSRQVLRATINLPHIGDCDCYVVHFKSKRPMLEHEESKSLSGEKNIIEKLKAQVAGGWGSTIQRGSEAALLLVNMIARREETGLPMILMGDFNNILADGVLDHLVTDTLRFVSKLDSDAYLEKYCLKDSWDLFQGTENNTEHILRKPTHYFGASSSVLDYILLSCEFDANYHSSLFEVSEYNTYDRHLINPIFDRDGESTDHGVVLVTLQLRS
ncbi:Endonuclease/exonuclease/phosphatase [Psychromonas ingrahamii 37]|uniref:Endonuclease/exonuclease/phosphatase n=1 Tax=Psychromonas ingrahamii (strain DSM 17664 / CCUG 51855 / 37) TaxID=357804 RepID=A1STP4_PSYIN|nr:endonuclease/exonuclease/phosphatase family protein [Psychromonas ingrahamii]ABM02859.1 Endonuclease/exonuclease/phosphatase [Psychromonas ingrahamii 37]